MYIVYCIYIYIYIFKYLYYIMIDYDVAFIRASGLQSHLGRVLRNKRRKESGKHGENNDE